MGDKEQNTESNTEGLDNKDPSEKEYTDSQLVDSDSNVDVEKQTENDSTLDINETNDKDGHGEKNKIVENNDTATDQVDSCKDNYLGFKKGFLTSPTTDRPVKREPPIDLASNNGSKPSTIEETEIHNTTDRLDILLDDEDEKAQV